METEVNEHELFIRTIKASLKAHRYTARQLALAIDVDPSYITRILGGERNPPSEELLAKIAEVLKLDPDRLRYEAGLLPQFMKSRGPLSDKDFQALRSFMDEIRQDHKRDKTERK